jgi:hypothetical protein
MITKGLCDTLPKPLGDGRRNLGQGKVVGKRHGKADHEFRRAVDEAGGPQAFA